VPHCRGYTAMRTRSSDQTREIAVRNELANFQFGNKMPDVELKRSSFHMQGEFEAPQAFAEIRIDLPLGLTKQRIARARRVGLHASGKAGPNDRIAPALNDEPGAEGGLHCQAHASAFGAWRV
jgi:hypothetical protein